MLRRRAVQPEHARAAGLGPHLPRREPPPGSGGLQELGDAFAPLSVALPAGFAPGPALPSALAGAFAARAATGIATAFVPALRSFVDSAVLVHRVRSACHVIVAPVAGRVPRTVHTGQICARSARNKGRTGGIILQAPHDAE